MNCLMTAWHENEAELRGWLRHRLGNPVDADDMLQDLFIKAMRQGERFCAIGNARAWLFEVARNALADRLRLKREMIELPADWPTKPRRSRRSIAWSLPAARALRTERRRSRGHHPVRPRGPAAGPIRAPQGLEPAGSQVPDSARSQTVARTAVAGVSGASGRSRPGERFRTAPAAQLNWEYSSTGERRQHLRKCDAVRPLRRVPRLSIAVVVVRSRLENIVDPRIGRHRGGKAERGDCEQRDLPNVGVDDSFFTSLPGVRMDRALGARADGQGQLQQTTGAGIELSASETDFPSTV